MTSLEAYQELLLKVNRNDSNSNIHVPRAKFVIVYNEQQRNWLKETLKNNLDSDDLDELNDLLVDDVSLTKIKVHRDHVDFELPSDFYRFSNSYCLADRDECKGRPLVVWNTKSKNIRTLLQSENHNPSFDYEETICSIASEQLRVYFSDFTITDLFLEYYRFAKDIDLEGYVHLNGNLSTNIHPELGDDMVDEILNLCAKEIMRNNENANGLQFAKDRP
jgi:hypothetical protein